MKIVLGIPGPWADTVELGRAIAASNDGYHLHEGQLVGPGISAQLELIESCTYLICPGGSLDAGRNAMALAAVILRAGGDAVRVESAGLSHSAKNWLAQAERSETHVGALYIGYVALINRQGQVYSCGMHNLGFPDATVASTTSVRVAGELLRGFLMSVIHDQPLLVSAKSTLDDGAGTFYLLTHEACALCEPDDPFFNPFGVWRLTPVSLSDS